MKDRERQARLRRTRRYRRRTVRVMVDYSSPDGLHSEPATTLGAGGLFIESETPQRQGTPLKLRFQVPGIDRVHEIEGRVVWSAGPGDPGSTTPGMGIEFLERRAISQLAKDLETLD